MIVRSLLIGLAAATYGASSATTLESAFAPALSESEWRVIAPGAETTCAFNTPFQFFFREGPNTKLLLVYFEGGGACWNWVSCSGMFDTSVSDSELEGFRGIFDFARPDNPFKDASVLFVPYCTGDVHIGDATVRYGDPSWNPRPVEHRGWRNVSNVVRWARQEVKAPERLIVSGASAGSYGALFHALTFSQLYPGAALTVIGDSGLPLLANYGPVLDRWGATNVIRADWGGTSEDPDTVTLLTAHERIARLRPDAVIVHITSQNDAVQRAFYIMSGSGEAKRVTFELLEALQERIPQFRAFVIDGPDHGLMRTDKFYTYEVNGVGLTKWIADLIRGTSVASHYCEGCRIVPTM